MFKRLWLIVRSLLSIAQAPALLCLKFHLFHLRISFTSDFGPPAPTAVGFIADVGGGELPPRLSH